MDEQHLQIWAHRGGAHLGPENTLKTVKASLDTGVTGIHVNLQRLSDDTLVLFSDETLDEKTNLRGWVRYTPLTEFTKARIQGQPMYTMETFLPWFIEVTKRAFPRPTLNIEIPDTPSMQCFITFIKNYIDDGSIKAGDILVSSPDWKSLQCAYSKAPQIPLAGIFYGAPLHISDYMRDVPLRACHLYGHYVNKHFVRDVISVNIPVRVIGVNNPEHLMYYQDMGVSGIITDAPDIVR